MYIPRPIYPHPKGEFTARPTSLHESGGLSENWALDFMAHGGTTILAPQDCMVIRWSGHDPKTGVHGAAGDIYGWSQYLHVPDGFYFITHQSARLVPVGKWVRKGTPIGVVAHWPKNEPRSHSHIGFTHVKGKAASIERIRKVAAGPARPDPLL